MPVNHTSLLNLQAALCSSAGNTALAARNSSLVGALVDDLDPDLGSIQKALLKAVYAPLAEDPPATAWTFEALPAPIPTMAAFLIAVQHEDKSLHLRLISCPQLIEDEPTALLGTSHKAAFTRTTDPLPPSAFTVGDIELSKVAFPASPLQLVSSRLPLSLADKANISSYLGPETFATIRNLLPFRMASSAAGTGFVSPTRSTRSSNTNLALPTCWPLPIRHTITLDEDIPLPADAPSLQLALESLGCRDPTWLTEIPLLNVWLHAIATSPASFVPSQEFFFGLNEAMSLQEYRSSIQVCRLIIADSLAHRGKPKLLEACIADPTVLTNESFPPPVIAPTDLCPQSLEPPLPWTPSFSFAMVTPPPPPKFLQDPSLPVVVPASASVSSATSTLSSLPLSKKLGTTQLRWMSFLACHLPAKDSTSFRFPGAPTTFHITPANEAYDIPEQACLLTPLHETFDSFLRAKSATDAGISMAHRFELSRSSATPNIVTNFLLHCGPAHGAFFSATTWELILSANLCATPLSATPFQGFSPLLLLLLDPSAGHATASHPVLPPQGFASFSDVLRCVNSCKWFIMTIATAGLYSSTIAYQGLDFLESEMISSNLAARWQEPTIRTATATYQVLELIHNLFAIISGTASNLPPSSLIPVAIHLPVCSQAYVFSPVIKDATLTIDLDAALRQWTVSCRSVLADLRGTTSSLSSLLLATQPTAFNHYLFRPFKKRNLPVDDTRPPRADKRADRPPRASSKPTKPDTGKAILKPTVPFSIQDILKTYTEGKITPPRLPSMKGIRNSNGAALCLPFLLGCECQSTEPCGYHLQVQPAASLPGQSSSDWTPFHDWLLASKEHVTLTSAATMNSKISPP